MHQPRKRFGQNFLIDETIIERIAQVVNTKSTDHLVEIGPGQGALTSALIGHCQQYSAIELDRDLIEPLQKQFQKHTQFTLYSADALEFDYTTLSPHPFRVVGNLPYNISAPLLVHFMQYIDRIQDIHVMVQQEMADRITAVPNNKDYGRLSVMLQYFCQTYPLITVPPESFFPAPKVMSTVIRLVPYAQKPHLANSLKNLDKLLRQAFSQRRKTIANTLKPFFSKEQLISWNMDPQRRPETLSVGEYVQLSNHL